RRAGAVRVLEYQSVCESDPGGGRQVDVQGLLQLLQLPPAGREEARRSAHRLGARPGAGAQSAQPRVDPALAQESSGGSAGNQDAVVLPGWPRRHPGRQRNRADQGDSRLCILVWNSPGSGIAFGHAGQGDQQVGNRITLEPEETSGGKAMKKFAVLAAGCAAIAIGIGGAAYQAAADGGGTISGTVKYDGTAPA